MLSPDERARRDAAEDSRRESIVDQYGAFGSPRVLRARKAALERHGNSAMAEVVDRELRTAMLAQHIQRAMAEDPPLTAEQRSALAALLLGKREENR